MRDRNRSELRPSRSVSDRLRPSTVLRPLQEFLSTSTASAFLLLAAAVVALVWANAPFGDGYDRLWRTPIGVGVGTWSIELDLRHWVNDGLMSLFFLVVGLEIKREVLQGELRDLRAAALPAIAAAGGMVVPAALYLAVNAGGPGAHGWGIPMPTDIVFALSVVTLAAARAPAQLKPFVLTLAIVDDTLSILVIALFYSGGVSAAPLLACAAIVSVILVLQRIHVRATTLYVVLALGLWVAVYESGVHPTLAGVAMGLLTPISPFPQPASDASPLVRVEHALLPWTSFVIVPLFALANAGIDLSGATVAAAAASPIAIGVVLGRVGGKTLGIWAASAAAVRFGVARLPTGLELRHVRGAGVVAGVGFTVALFITELSFEEPALRTDATIGIVAASVAAGILGWLVLRRSGASDT